MISTRGRYSVRVLLDLAEHRNGGYIPMKEVAARQEISLKYLERIMPLLTQAGLVEGVHGKGGGYRLCRPLADYRAGEIIRLAEGEGMASVSCLKGEKQGCEKAGHCRALPLWQGLDKVIYDYLDSISLADLQGMEEI